METPNFKIAVSAPVIDDNFFLGQEVSFLLISLKRETFWHFPPDDHVFLLRNSLL